MLDHTRNYSLPDPMSSRLSDSNIARLADRGTVSVSGPDARKLLQGLITNDMDLLEAAPGLHAGLLTPQGKILFGFHIAKSESGYLLDVARDHAPGLVKRLSLYKLRADVGIRDESSDHAVLVMWGDASAPGSKMGIPDPRLAEMGQRAIVAAGQAAEAIATSGAEEQTAAAYHAHRIGLGVPEGGKDYAFGEAFPHEALFDQLNGVSFTKGCYVGQEIVSRMEHRSTARRRIVPVIGREPLPQPGTDVTAAGVSIGTLGSTAGTRGLALLRLDRVAEFAARGEQLFANNVSLEVKLPEWARFKLDIKPQD